MYWLILYIDMSMWIWAFPVTWDSKIEAYRELDRKLWYRQTKVKYK